MVRHYLAVFGFLGLAACATSGPVPTAPGETRPAASQDRDDAGTIEVAKIPEVPAAAAVSNRSEKICYNEKRTGTNRVQRVCRSQAEIEQEELEGRKIFEKLHKRQEDYR